MQKKIRLIGTVLLIASSLQLKAQKAAQDTTYKRWFVGSTLYLLGILQKNAAHSPLYLIGD